MASEPIICFSSFNMTHKFPCAIKAYSSQQQLPACLLTGRSSSLYSYMVFFCLLFVCFFLLFFVICSVKLVVSKYFGAKLLAEMQIISNQFFGFLIKKFSFSLLIRDVNCSLAHGGLPCAVPFVISGRFGNWLAANKDCETVVGFFFFGSSK